VKLPPFQALLDAHSGEVYRFLVATAGPGDADDCFQDTWVAAMRAYPRLRRADNLRAWLFRIAHNKAIDAHRARSRRAVPVANVPERRNPELDAGPELDPGAELDEPELWDAVRQLPPKQRAAVYCRSVLGIPYD
jgi:RNA polymerase sigma factor (sigma-70 family)